MFFITGYPLQKEEEIKSNLPYNEFIHHWRKLVLIIVSCSSFLKNRNFSRFFFYILFHFMIIKNGFRQSTIIMRLKLVQTINFMRLWKGRILIESWKKIRKYYEEKINWFYVLTKFLHYQKSLQIYEILRCMR